MGQEPNDYCEKCHRAYSANGTCSACEKPERDTAGGTTETQSVVMQVLAEDAARKPHVVAEQGDALKKDFGKAPWHLAPWDAFKCIVAVLAFGAAKYRERGWEEGMQWSRLFSAAQRHLTDWFHRVDKGKGPGKDADTGYSDLWHCACCVCFLIAYELRGGKHAENDDRPKL